MPVFRDESGPNARFLEQERRRQAETPHAEPAPAQVAPAVPAPAKPLGCSALDPKWDRRWRQLADRCDEIWGPRGRNQIEQGSNLWDRIAKVSGQASDEIWEYALDQLATSPQYPRVIATYFTAILERAIANPPAALSQAAADERIPVLVPNLDLPWVRHAEEQLSERIKRALASSADPDRNTRSAATASPKGLPQAQALEGADPQGQARGDSPARVHGVRDQPVVPHRRRTQAP